MGKKIEGSIFVESRFPKALRTSVSAQHNHLRESLCRQLAPQLHDRPNADRSSAKPLDKSEGVFLYIERLCDDMRQNHPSLGRPNNSRKASAASSANGFNASLPTRKYSAKTYALRIPACSISRESPHYYHWGVIQARRHLLELGERQPELPLILPSQARIQLADVLELDEQQKKKARIRAEFTEFLRSVTGHYRYAPTKFLRLLREDWEAIRSLIEERGITVKPQFVEIHVGHPCNLNCGYCRGGLRNKPKREEFLPKDQTLSLIKKIYGMNPRAFVRFSGLIAEPLLHPDIIDILDFVGKKHEMQWGLTTNGIRLEGEKLLKTVLTAKYVHLSVDAGSNETYRALKGGGSGAMFDRVVHNIGELAGTRSESASKTAIVVSFLLQAENYCEVPKLARILKEARADSLEVKMEHFDPRRAMACSTHVSKMRVIRETL